MQASSTPDVVKPQSMTRGARDQHRSLEIWLLWVAFTIGGYLVSAALSIVLARLSPDTPGMLAFGLLGTLLSQVAIGVLQWLVLRRYIPGMRWLGWVLATVLGQFLSSIIVLIVVAGPVIFGLGADWPEAMGASTFLAVIKLLAGALHGAVIGFLQGLVLQRYLRGALWWLPASIIAWALSEVISLADGLDFGLGGAMALVSGKAISGAILGVITGAALVWILGRSQQTAQPMQTSIPTAD